MKSNRKQETSLKTIKPQGISTQVICLSSPQLVPSFQRCPARVHPERSPRAPKTSSEATHAVGVVFWSSSQLPTVHLERLKSNVPRPRPSKDLEKNIPSPKKSVWSCLYPLLRVLWGSRSLGKWNSLLYIYCGAHAWPWHVGAQTWSGRWCDPVASKVFVQKQNLGVTKR